MSRPITSRFILSCSITSRFLVIGVAAALFAPHALAADDPGWLITFTDAERRAVLQHGPWPPPSVRDPSNRVSGHRDAIVLGERLFFDARVSGSGRVACATCHVPEKGWTDGRNLSVGQAEGDRHTPSIHNVRLHRWFGWDGASDNLWAQSVRPMLDPREMGASGRHVAALVRGDPELSCRYRHAFGAPPPSDDEAVLVDAGKALAAFQETIGTGGTPFDAFRDAMEKGDTAAARRYPEAAQRGLRIFVGKGNCSRCHAGPNFTHGEFHEIGIPSLRKSGGVDGGRYEGIGRLQASRFNLLGGYNDDRKSAPGMATRNVARSPQTSRQFRVPSLRNVARTAPYMHNGSLATLPDVVRHYSTVDPKGLNVASASAPADVVLKPLRLTSQEISYVVAFLQSLSDAEPAFRPALPVPCR